MPYVQLLKQSYTDDDCAAEIIKHALGIASEDVARYCFPTTWPLGREQRTTIIGGVAREARSLAS